MARTKSPAPKAKPTSPRKRAARTPPPPTTTVIDDATEATAEPTLEEEIKMLRRIGKLLAKKIESADEINLIRLLDKLGAANIRVARLLKSQKELVGNKDELGGLVQKVLEELMKDEGVTDDGGRTTDASRES